MQSDQIVKEMLQEFLPEFLDLFYPDIAVRIDFNRVEFLDKEAFTDVGEGTQRTADLVARLYSRDGEPEILLLHQESQQRRGGDFPFRMFEYFALLRLRHRLPVLSLVVYLTPGAGGIAEETYTEALWGRTHLNFWYHVVGLPDLNAPDYEALDNPLAPALSAIMRNGAAPIERKLQIFSSDALLRQNDARRALLLNFVNAALPLGAAEEAVFEQRLQQTRGEVTEMLTIYEQRGIEKGLSRGRSEGRFEGRQELLLEQMEARFGALPESVRTRISGITDVDELRSLGLRLLTAESLEDMGFDAR